MGFAMKRRLRRIAAGLLASVAAAGALVVSSAAPASADTYTAWNYFTNAATHQCLATDFSTSVYTFAGCNGPQRWRAQNLAAYPGTFMLQNEATGRCLKQVTISRVVSASCDGSIIEFRWRVSSGFIWSDNTLGWLVTDYSQRVYLYNGTTPPGDQWWGWKYSSAAGSASLSPFDSLVH
ncbi:hypothetical protein [Micromonospora orduensis]|uniref:hypothetical protein n=1 Tax=Micromonospora orduensis TaxID=1420891 RepID=UPI0033D45FC0